MVPQAQDTLDVEKYVTILLVSGMGIGAYIGSSHGAVGVVCGAVIGVIAAPLVAFTATCVLLSGVVAYAALMEP